MIPLTNKQIEDIRALAEQEIQSLYGEQVKLYIRDHKCGDYVRYLLVGPELTKEELAVCHLILTDSGSIIGKVFFDE